MSSNCKTSGEMTEFDAARIKVRGAQDEFEVTLTVQCEHMTLNGVARVAGDEMDRLYRYFRIVRNVSVILEGSAMIIIVDAGVPAMPEFRRIVPALV